MTALQNSSSAMAVANNSLDETIALITAGTEIVQDSSKVGNALRTISMRIRGMNEETEELDDELVNIKGDVYELTNGKVSIMQDADTYKSTTQVLREVAEVWDELSDKSQANLLEKLFGKTRAQVGAAILSNFEQVEKALDVMSNSAGAADREMDIITNSLEYKINALKETFTGIWQNLFQREDMGVLVDGLTSVLGVIDAVTEKIGLFGTAIAGLSIAAIVKDLGGITTGIKGLFEGLSLARNISEIPTALGIGFEALASAIGVSTVALGAFIGIAAGIVGVIALVDYLNESYKEAKTKADDSRQAYEDNKAQLEDVTSQLETIQSRMAELNASQGLTFIEQQELANLEQANQKLLAQKKILEQMNGITQKAAAEDAANVLEKKSFDGADIYSQTAYGEEWMGYEQIDILDKWTYTNNKITGQQKEQVSIGEQLTQNKQDQIDLQKKLDSYAEEDKTGHGFGWMFGTDEYEADKKELKALQAEEKRLTTQSENLGKSIKSMQNELPDLSADIELYASSLYDENGQVIEGFEDLASRYETEYLGISYSAEQTAKKTQQAYDDIISSRKDFQNQYQSLIETAKSKSEEGGLTLDDLVGYEDLVSEMSANGFTAEDIVMNVNAEAEIVNKGELQNQVQESIDDQIEEVENEQKNASVDVEVEYDSEKARENADEIMSIYENLTADSQLKLKDFIDNSKEWMDWDFGDIQANIDALINGTDEAESSVQDLTGTMQDLQLVMNDSSDNGLTKAISNYKDQMNTLISARDKWNNGELSVEEMTTLQQSFIELNNFDMSNFGQGIETAIDNVVGKFQEADATFTDFKQNIIDKDDTLKDALSDISSITKKGFKDAEAGITEEYDESVNRIMDAAAHAGLVNRNNKKEVDAFIDSLFESGIIQGKVNDITEKSTGLMGAFGKAIKSVGGEETIAGRALVTMRDNLLGIFNQTDEVTSTYSALKDTLGTFTQYQTDVSAALKASKSATGLTAEQVQTLTTAYQDLDGFNPATLFEKTANGIHLNEEEFKRLNQEVQNSTLLQMYSDLGLKLDELHAAQARGEDTSGLEKDIADAQMLIAQYEGLTSALYAWQNAQSNGNERDSFESVAKGYDSMKKILDQGWVGDESLNAYLDLMLNESERTGDAIADFEKLGRTIEGTNHSLKDYFTFDENGNLNPNGLNDFLTDVQSKFGEGYASFNDEDGWTFDFSGDKLQEVAKAFGTTTEFIQLMERAMIDAGAEVEMSSSELATMKKTLDGLKSEGKISPDIDLGDFDASTATAEELQSVIDRLNEERVRIEAESDGSEETLQTLETLERTVNSLEAQKVRTSIEVAVNNGNSVEELLAMDDTTLAATLNVDASEVDTAREQLEALNGATESTTVTVTLDSSQFEALTDTSKTVTVSYSVDAPDAPTYEDQEPSVKYGIDAPDAPKYPNQDPKITYHLSAPSEPVYRNIDRTITYTIKTVGTPPSGSGGVDGTAHAFGTAYARGNWGTKHGGIALGGELGQELVVRDGKFFTIGDDSAEFFRYQPDDIIFNAEQTREIFAKGKITHGVKRGKALYTGTAFDGGKWKTPTTTTKQQSSGGSGSGGSGSGGSGSGGKTDTNKEKSTIDWIERRLKYFADKVKRIADTITDYVSSAVKESKLKKERSVISKEIKANSKAYDKYLKYANNVKLDSSLKKKVRSGNYSIKDYDEDTQKQIEKYKEYYDKAQDCKDKVTELKNTQLELFEDLMNIPTEKAEKKIDKLKDKFDSLSASIDASSTGMSGVSALMSLNNKSIASAQKDYTKDADTRSQAQSNLNKAASKLTKKDKKAKKNSDGTYKLPKNKKKASYKRLKAYNSALKKSKSANSAYSIAKNNYKQISNLYELQGSGETYNYQNALIDAETANLKEQNKANQTALKEANANLSSAKSANSSASKSVTKKASSLAKSKNKKLASRVKSANGDKISTKGLSGKALKQAKAYNKLVDEAKTKAQELTIAQDAQAKAAQNAAQSQAEYAQQLVQAEQDKFNNVKTYYEAQSDYLDSIRDKQEAANDLKTTKGLMLTAKDYNNLISENDKAIDNLNKESVALKKQLDSAVNSGNIKKNSEEWKTMQAEINAVEKATTDLQVQQQEYNNAIAQLPFDKIEKQLEYLDSISDLLSSKQALKEAKGLSLTLSDYSASIAENENQIAEYQEEYNEAIANIAKANADSEGVYGGKTAKEWETEANGYMKSVTDMTKANVELANSIAQLPFDKIEKQLEYLKAQADYNESARSLREAQGSDLREVDYQNRIAEAKQQQAQYEQERNEAYQNYLKALADGEGVYGGKTASEWMKEYNEFGKEINDISVDIEKIKDDLRDDVYWRAFERAHQSAERLQAVLAGINGLIDDNSLFDKNGNLTDYGVSRIANLVKSFENARTEVNNYSNDIANLNKLYSQGYYTELEYKEKLNELQKGMLDSASDMKSYQDTIIDMYKNIAQSELDALNKLIDKRAEALNKKKAYYEYDKNIRKQTDDLQTLQAQLAALEGINTLEATAKRRKLELEISEKQSDLDDTVQDHIFDLSQDALNDLKDTLQEAFDDKWDNISGNLKEIATLMGEAKTLTTTGMYAINSTLNSLLSYYGINVKTSGIDAAFASGTTGVSRRLKALIGEDGSEIAATKDGLILTLDRGDGVIPHEMTENLMRMAQGIIPNIATDNVKLPNVDIDRIGETNVEQHYDSLIHIDGSADAATVEDIKRMTGDLLDKSYKYTSQKIHEGYLKAGGRRKV